MNTVTTKLRSRIAPKNPEDRWDPHGKPVDLFLHMPGASALPIEGQQFILPDQRAFSVDLVEWRYDLGEVHLFCTEYPAEENPVHSCVDPTNESACRACIAEGRL